MKTIYSLFLVPFLLLITHSCTYDIIIEPEIEIPDEPISFVEEVEPIFSEAGCINCHNGGALQPDLRKGYAYESIMSKTDLTNYEYDKNLYDYPKPSGSHNNKYKNEEQAIMIKIWIDQGALNN